MTETLASPADLAAHWGCEPTEDSLSRCVYKSTDCGAWLAIVHRADGVTGIRLGSIVEGADDWNTHSYTLWFPCTVADVSDRLDRVECEARAIWDATHTADGDELPRGQWTAEYNPAVDFHDLGVDMTLD